MAKLARVFHFNRDMRELLDQVFADHPGMERGAAAGQNNPADIA